MADDGGRVVVITGGASGIGQACARRFGAAGDRIVVCDLDEASGAETVRELADRGIAAGFVRLDVTDEAAVRAAADAVAAAHGRVDVLVNSAGLLQKISTLETCEEADEERVMRVNYHGTFVCSRWFGLKMAERGSGAVVNIASTSGYMNLPTFSYSASKAAVITITGTLGVELGRRGVRVNAIAPGPVMTDIQKRNIQAGLRDPAAMSRYTALNPWIEPEEIADGAFFLASDQARAITGITLPIDAGLLAGVGWSMLGGIPRD